MSSACLASPFDWESIGKDGEKKYIETSVSSMLDSEGQPIGLRGVARDVTERKIAEESLKSKDKKLEIKENKIKEINKTMNKYIEKRKVKKSSLERRNISSFSRRLS